MNLFSITSPRTSCDKNAAGLSTWSYGYSLRFQVRNSGYLRVGEGFGSFSNVNPDILPGNATLTKVVISNDESDTDEFTIELYKNALLDYSLTKPAGNTQETATGLLSLFTAGDALCVRITGITTPVDGPRVRLYFEEVA